MKSATPATPHTSEVIEAMNAISQVFHYDGTGWHGFRNVVKAWLAESGIAL